jgi:hypothetical protein
MNESTRKNTRRGTAAEFDRAIGSAAVAEV